MKNKGINVVSFFDGMGCLYIALKELGIKINNYYSFEIDKFAIQQTKLNFKRISKIICRLNKIV
jgi:site-specific DNA-cytosine methylase